jgi:hypothetical protein
MERSETSFSQTVDQAFYFEEV